MIVKIAIVLEILVFKISLKNFFDIIIRKDTNAITIKVCDKLMNIKFNELSSIKI
jgi:hypothetical protein